MKQFLIIQPGREIPWEYLNGLQNLLYLETKDWHTIHWSLSVTDDFHLYIFLSEKWITGWFMYPIMKNYIEWMWPPEWHEKDAYIWQSTTELATNVK